VHKTYIGDVGVLIGSHRVQFSCNRGAEYHKILLDDQPLERGIAFTLSDENNAIILRDASDKVCNYIFKSLTELIAHGLLNN